MTGGRRYSVISLFSGAMGLDLGLEQTGRFETRACVEFVPTFCETIKRNRDRGMLVRRDVAVICKDVRELHAEDILKAAKMDPGQVDVVAGGPPCQAFSVFGRRRGMEDSRGRVIFDFVRLVGELKPRAFVMENVRGLQSMKLSPSADKGSLLRKLQESFNGLGYATDAFLVNSANYGAPQIRERIIMIGNPYGEFAEFPPPTHSDRPKDRLPPFATLGDAIRGKPDPDPTVMEFSPRKRRYLAMVPPGGNWRSLPVELQKESMGKSWYLKGGRSAYWRKLSYEFPCPTVMTLPNHAGTSMCHPDELRPLSVGECTLVQEFPPGWRFEGTPAERYMQVGNAVPVRLGKVAGGALAALLDRMEGIHLEPKERVPANTLLYLRSHVRTRWWWKDGQVVHKLPYAAKPGAARLAAGQQTIAQYAGSGSEGEGL
jgi:DNA (cytosine-5)-methyltransferase 1